MIRLFVAKAGGGLDLTSYPDAAGLPDGLPDGTRWIDLEAASPAGRDWVERAVRVPLPTPEQRAEIEHSSRYYSTHGADILTLPVAYRTGGEDPILASLTLVRTSQLLITYREAALPALAALVAQQAAPESEPVADGAAGVDGLLIATIETLVDRAADTVEVVADRMTELSRSIFRPDSGSVAAMKRRDGPDLERAIRDLGHLEEVLSLIGQHLAGLARAVAFLDLRLKESGGNGDLRRRLRTQSRDVTSIVEQSTALSGKAAFLLDATLGMINLGQTKVLNVFSVLATVFLPPTLIASLYGMNFERMPELDSPWGYPLALLAMLISALLPLWLIKRKGWL